VAAGGGGVAMTGALLESRGSELERCFDDAQWDAAPGGPRLKPPPQHTALKSRPTFAFAEATFSKSRHVCDGDCGRGERCRQTPSYALVQRMERDVNREKETNM